MCSHYFVGSGEPLTALVIKSSSFASSCSCASKRTIFGFAPFSRFFNSIWMPTIFLTWEEYLKILNSLILTLFNWSFLRGPKSEIYFGHSNLCSTTPWPGATIKGSFLNLPLSIKLFGITYRISFEWKLRIYFLERCVMCWNKSMTSS